MPLEIEQNGPLVRTVCVCNHCGHRWYPRGKRVPPTCPKCRIPTWNENGSEPR